MDYILFKERGRLIPKAKYFPPPCLKTDLEYTCSEIEDDLEEYCRKERAVITFDLMEKDKLVMKEPEVIGEINAHSVDSEMIKKMKECENRCDICLLAKQDCHNVLFGA